MALNQQIAQLLVEKGRAQAAGEVGAGQAYGQALSNIGQTVAQIPQTIEVAKQTRDADRARAARDAFSTALKDIKPIDQQGISLYDINGIGEKMTQAGYGDEFLASANHLAAINDAKLAVRQAQQNVVKQGAAAVAASGNDPTIAKHFLDTLGDIYPKEQIDKFREFIDADPGNTEKLTAYLAGPQKLENAAAGSAARSPLTGKIVPGSEVAEKPTEASLAATANDETKAPPVREAARKALEALQAPTMATQANAKARAEEDARHNKEMEGIAKMTQGREAARDAEVRRHNLATESQQEAAPELTPEARDMAANQFAMTGTLPPMGMGKAGAKVRTEIMNRAADLYKNLDMATQRAAYESNKKSLSTLTTQRDNITSFENTARKNIDLFLDTAGKVVDTGSPLANRPLRAISGKILGSPDQAAFDAARQVAVNEIAKVTSGGGLSSVLSDSARHEIAAFNPENATLSQTVAVMRLLKQDMANRSESLDEQIKAIRSRIATKPGETPKEDAPKTKVGQFTVTVK